MFYMFPCHAIVKWHVSNNCVSSGMDKHTQIHVKNQHK